MKSEIVSVNIVPQHSQIQKGGKRIVFLYEELLLYMYIW
jgi:hypothetical protein